MNKIIERIQKYLAMAKSDNEHEAALAASRAASLMEEHQLTEAQLRVEDTSRAAEPIVEEARLDDGLKKRVAWRECVADAVARSLDLKFYISCANGKTHYAVFGREGATQAWRYTTQFLCREIEQLADSRWEAEREMAEAVGQSARAWKNAFRVGAASRVAGDLVSEHRSRQQVAEARARAADAAIVRGPDEPTTTALDVIARDRDEVETAYAEHSRGWGKSSGIGSTRSRDGYVAGREAGGSIQRGGGRGALPAGQGRLAS